MNIERLRLADRALQELLEVREEEQVSLIGKCYPSAYSTESVRNFCRDSENTWLHDMFEGHSDDTEYFLRRFCEMRRRVNKKVQLLIDANLDGDIFRLVAIRCGALLSIFNETKLKERRSIGSSVLHNSMFVGGILFEDEFFWCEDYPELVKNAVRGNPSDPRAFLRQVKTDIDTIPTEEEFVWCKDHPGLVMHAAKSNPSAPRAFLRQVKTDIDTIPTEEEFMWCKDYPGLVKRAVKDNPSKPREYLRSNKPNKVILSS